MHNGGDETARQGGAVQGRGHSKRGRSGAKLLCAASTGREEKRTVVGGDRAEAVQRETGWLTGGAGLSAMRGRERARVSAAGGWGRAAAREKELAGRAGARERKQAGGGPRGGEVASAGRERLRVWAENRPSQGEGFSFFLISYFYFLFLFLLSPFLLNN